MVKRELGSEQGGFTIGAFLQDFAEVFGFQGGELTEAEVVPDEQVRADHLVAELEGHAGTPGMGVLFEPVRDRLKQNGVALLTGEQAYGVGEEGFTDTGLTDEKQRAAVFEPMEVLDFFDLGLGDRAFGGRVEVLEGGLSLEARGFDAAEGLFSSPVIGLSLKEGIEGFLPGEFLFLSLGQEGVTEGGHTGQFQLQHERFELGESHKGFPFVLAEKFE